MSQSLKNLSRKDYPTSEVPSHENIQTSALMRIADAAEVMSQNYVKLQNDLEWYKKGYRERGDKIASQERSIASLKGHITRLKNKMKNI